jgi:hypothetical protein
MFAVQLSLKNKFAACEYFTRRCRKGWAVTVTGLRRIGRGSARYNLSNWLQIKPFAAAALIGTWWAPRVVPGRKW